MNNLFGYFYIRFKLTFEVHMNVLFSLHVLYGSHFGQNVKKYLFPCYVSVDVLQS